MANFADGGLTAREERGGEHRNGSWEGRYREGRASILACSSWCVASAEHCQVAREANKCPERTRGRRTTDDGRRTKDEGGEIRKSMDGAALESEGAQQRNGNRKFQLELLPPPPPLLSFVRRVGLVARSLLLLVLLGKDGRRTQYRTSENAIHGANLVAMVGPIDSLARSLVPLQRISRCDLCSFITHSLPS